MKNIELEIITNYYGDRRANRSGVLLINHIHEGLAILDAIKASEKAKKAFCIHPITQMELDIDLSNVRSTVISTAKEYAKVANYFLCQKENDHIQTIKDLQKHFKGWSISKDVQHMLIADKVQNRKDFKLYHLNTHSRSKELSRYFDLWIDFLENFEKNS